MRSPVGIRRVVVVVLDGLRPDAVNGTDHPHLTRLARGGATAADAQTIEPSVTAAAMATLLTGVMPSTHGVRSDRFHIPRSSSRLAPVPKLLAAGHFPTSAYLTEIPSIFRGIASRIANQLGVIDTRFIGANAAGVLRSATHAIALQRRGLIVMHWPDADRAGHACGWMSPEYLQATRAMDAQLGILASMLEVPRDPGTLIIALSDHGGGGVDPRDHESDHPLDRRIVLTLAGGGVQRGIIEAASLVDVPATILWALGVPVPNEYAGRPLTAAFHVRREPEPVAA